MANKLKPRQKSIVDFIEANGCATPRQIRTLLLCDIREANDRLHRLVKADIVKNIGKPHRPEYRLVQRWQAKIKTPNWAAEVRSVADVCCENWQGYQVHKIFGSVRV